MTKEMIRRLSFWRLYAFSICMAAVGSTVISLARDLAMSVGAGALLAANLVGLLAVCNGTGRLMAGALFDTLGMRKTIRIANMITVLAPVTTLAAVLGGSLPLCITGLCLTGLSFGCNPPINAAVVLAFYGLKYNATNFSFASTMLIFTSFVATLTGMLITATGSYVVPFILLIILSAVSLLLGLGIRRP